MPCVTGSTVKDPTTAAGVRPRPGYLGDTHRQEVSFPNHPSRPQASVIGTHQVASEASLHPGLYSFQNRDQRIASLFTSDYSHRVPPGYDRQLEADIHKFNLSTQSFNVVFRGENLDPTHATSALNSGSKVPRHPVIGQLEIDSGQSEMPTLFGPNRLVENIWHSTLSNQPSVSPVLKTHQDTAGLKFDIGKKTQNLQKRLDMLNLFGSRKGGSRMNNKGTRGVLPKYDPPLFSSQARYSPFQSGKHENYSPAQTKPAALQRKMDPLRPVGPKRGSSARSQSEQNLEKSGSTEWSHTDGLNSKVHNVRVKPPSRFVSSASPLRQKPSVLPLKLGPTASSSQKRVADQGPSSTRLPQYQPTHLQNPVHSPPNRPMAGTADSGSAFALRNPLQAAGKIGMGLFQS